MSSFRLLLRKVIRTNVHLMQGPIILRLALIHFFRTHTSILKQKNEAPTTNVISLRTCKYRMSHSNNTTISTLYSQIIITSSRLQNYPQLQSPIRRSLKKISLAPLYLIRSSISRHRKSPRVEAKDIFTHTHARAHVCVLSRERSPRRPTVLHTVCVHTHARNLRAKNVLRYVL